MSETSPLEAKAVEIITNLEKLAEPAMQLTLQAIQASAAVGLAFGAVAGIAAIFLIRFSWKQSLAATAASYDKDGPYIYATAIYGICGFIATIISIANLTIVNRWIALFAPDLALARILIEKTLG